ncbi:hypothetical protein [Halostella pelagica]|uniref:hypothetical protein n=1 Tax=Halostella pelagica TaxID=2583824 RepID=UPI00108099CC|nr:hypothetical protein [Halostella pelagica]
MQTTQRNLKNHTTSSGRSDAKPAAIIHENGEIIHAPDHDTRGGWVIIYRAEKPGVDRKIPRERVVDIDRIHDDCNRKVTEDDTVEWCSESWTVVGVTHKVGMARLEPRTDAARDLCPESHDGGKLSFIDAPVDQITVTGENDNDGPHGTADGEIVTDGSANTKGGEDSW